MSVDQVYIVTCDECCEPLEKDGATLVSDTEREADSAAESAGWVGVDQDGFEEHLCPTCRKAVEAARAQSGE